MFNESRQQLLAHISAQAAELQQLKAAAHVKDTAWQQLQSLLTCRDSALQQLHEHVRHLQADITDKTSIIQRLGAGHLHLTPHSAGVKPYIVASTDQLQCGTQSSQQQLMRDTDIAWQHLQAMIAGRDHTIQQLNSHAEQLEADVAARNRIIQQLQADPELHLTQHSTIQQLQRVIANKDSKLQHLSNAIAVTERQVQQLNHDLTLKEQALREMQTEYIDQVTLKVRMPYQARHGYMH